VTGLILNRGWWHAARIVALESIAETGDSHLRLTGTQNDLLLTSRYIALEGDRVNIQPGHVVLDGRTDVLCADDRLGRLGGVNIDNDTAQLGEVCVDAGWLRDRIVIPGHGITALSNTSITLRRTQRELDKQVSGGSGNGQSVLPHVIERVWQFLR
jgi:hypothetical protein